VIGIYQFDGAALMIIIALFVAALSKKMYKNRSSKVFMILLVAMAITTICDAMSCFSPMLSYG
jgi:NhaP-type Na+/H+ or K+/H+ antiporter